MPQRAYGIWLQTVADRLRDLAMPLDELLHDIGINRTLIDRPEYRILPRDRSGSATGL